ncbi:MAG: DNRLRE domain-containing protein [Spirochaetales bacterium]|nr:DNRLRE domain-containing protein [Spirochaetales bacterium]
MKKHLKSIVLLMLLVMVVASCTLDSALLENENVEGKSETNLSVATKGNASVVTVILYAQQDGRVYDIAPDNPAGYADYFAADAWTWSSRPGKVRSLLQFNLSSIASNKTITEAKLYLYSHPSIKHYSPSSTSTNAVHLYRVISPWSANTACWNNQPSISSYHSVQVPAAQYGYSSKNYVLDVTAMINDMYRYGNYGMMLKLDSENYYRRMYFASSECSQSSLRPRLVIKYK